MKKNLLFASLLSALLLFSASDSQAQRWTPKMRYWSIGTAFNVMQYMGDIVPRSDFASFDIKFTRPQFGFLLMRRLDPRWSVRASFAYGRLEGDDFTSTNTLVHKINMDEALTKQNANILGRWRRNLHFRNDIIEFSFQGVYDLVANPRLYYKRPNGFVPYVYFGVAGFYNNPKAKDLAGTWTALQPIRTENKAYSKYQVAIPLGAGIRYKIAAKWDIGVDVGLRYTFTDYVDDVSGNFMDLGELGSDQARMFHDRSQEPTAILKNQERDVAYLPTTMHTYVGVDGVTYTVYPGYGHGGDQAGKRGDPDENDQYIVGGFHIYYIIAPGVRCPKLR